MNQKKFVYAFAGGDGKNKKLPGGKGANPCEMTQIGLNVPPGFTINTEAYLDYLDAGHRLPPGAMDEVRKHMAQLEQVTGLFLDAVRGHTGKPFPQDLLAQIEIAIQAVFNSWMGKRAVFRRQPRRADRARRTIVREETKEVISPRPVTIRPLSPNDAAATRDIYTLAESGMVEAAIAKKEAILKKVRSLHEVNPILGHCGVRLGITFPEIYAMQIRTILEASAEYSKRGIAKHPDTMVSQVCTSEELKAVRKIVDDIRQQVEASTGQQLNFKFGTMIEVMRADKLPEEADLFSFGTDDLTQAAFSFSRGDAENKFLPMYNAVNILRDNPFEVLDVNGVGKLMELAVGWGARPNRNWRSASAASTADTRLPSTSATASGSATSRVPRRACPSPGSRPRMPH